MKQRLTLTVERSAVQAARRAARREGTSIAAIFERTFPPPAAPTPGFAERWLKKHPPAKCRPPPSSRKTTDSPTCWPNTSSPPRMRALIDSDVLVDVAPERTAWLADSVAVLDWAEQHPGPGGSRGIL